MYTEDNTGACTDTIFWQLGEGFVLVGYTDYIAETDLDWDYSCRYLFSLTDNTAYIAGGDKLSLMLTDSDDRQPLIFTITVASGD